MAFKSPISISLHKSYSQVFHTTNHTPFITYISKGMSVMNSVALCHTDFGCRKSWKETHDGQSVGSSRGMGKVDGRLRGRKGGGRHGRKRVDVVSASKTNTLEKKEM